MNELEQLFLVETEATDIWLVVHLYKCLSIREAATDDTSSCYSSRWTQKIIVSGIKPRKDKCYQL